MTDATSSFLGGRGAPAKATELNARASSDFAVKLTETQALLRQAAALGEVTQASSLGAEDVVITHLINALALDIPVFVLETGAQIAHEARRIYLQAGLTHAMPPGNLSYMEEEERRAIIDWFRAAGAAAGAGAARGGDPV